MRAKRWAHARTSAQLRALIQVAKAMVDLAYKLLGKDAIPPRARYIRNALDSFELYFHLFMTNMKAERPTHSKVRDTLRITLRVLPLSPCQTALRHQFCGFLMSFRAPCLQYRPWLCQSYSTKNLKRNHMCFYDRRIRCPPAVPSSPMVLLGCPTCIASVQACRRTLEPGVYAY